MTSFRIRIDRIIPTSLSSDSMRRVIEFDVSVDAEEKIELAVRSDSDEGNTADEVQAFAVGASSEELKLLAVGLDMVAEIFDFDFSGAEDEPETEEGAE